MLHLYYTSTYRQKTSFNLKLLVFIAICGSKKYIYRNCVILVDL